MGWNRRNEKETEWNAVEAQETSPNERTAILYRMLEEGDGQAVEHTIWGVFGDLGMDNFLDTNA